MNKKIFFLNLYLKNINHKIISNLTKKLPKINSS